MALTNYILQSVVFGFVFYGYGFGLFGKVQVGGALAGGVAFYLAQLALSRWWLSRFCFGPLEWLWRSFSYQRWQPLLREDARTISPGTLKTMLATTFLIVMPLIHLGGPLLLGRLGPRWGWSGGYPALLNLSGALPVVAGASLLGWVLSTMIGVVRTLPPLVRLGVRPTRLVQTGPYAWMRHPIYLGEGCFWVGMIVLLGSPVAATVFAGLLVLCLTWIIRREDRALEEQFGEDYRAYRARVPPLPGFRRAC